MLVPITTGVNADKSWRRRKKQSALSKRVLDIIGMEKESSVEEDEEGEETVYDPEQGKGGNKLNSNRERNAFQRCKAALRKKTEKALLLLSSFIRKKVLKGVQKRFALSQVVGFPALKIPLTYEEQKIFRTVSTFARSTINQEMWDENLAWPDREISPVTLLGLNVSL